MFRVSRERNLVIVFPILFKSPVQLMMSTDEDHSGRSLVAPDESRSEDVEALGSSKPTEAYATNYRTVIALASRDRTIALRSDHISDHIWELM